MCSQVKTLCSLKSALENTFFKFGRNWVELGKEGRCGESRTEVETQDK